MESKSSDSSEALSIDLRDSAGSGCCGLRSGEHAPAGTLVTNKRKGNNRRINAGAVKKEWEWGAILEAGGLLFDIKSPGRSHVGKRGRP